MILGNGPNAIVATRAVTNTISVSGENRIQRRLGARVMGYFRHPKNFRATSIHTPTIDAPHVASTSGTMTNKNRAP